jgi:phage terminase small subunit
MTTKPKKSIELKKLEGTYRKDRDANSVEPIIANYLEIPLSILPPENITDKLCREHYTHHVSLLANLKILTYSDLPEINLMYETLQEYRKIYSKLHEIDIEKDFEHYEALSKLVIKFSKRFSELAVKYCISPVARSRLTLDMLQIKKEADTQKTITGKLISKKKA